MVLFPNVHNRNNLAPRPISQDCAKRLLAANASPFHSADVIILLLLSNHIWHGKLAGCNHFSRIQPNSLGGSLLDCLSVSLVLLLLSEKTIWHFPKIHTWLFQLQGQPYLELLILRSCSRLCCNITINISGQVHITFFFLWVVCEKQ